MVVSAVPGWLAGLRRELTSRRGQDRADEMLARYADAFPDGFHVRHPPELASAWVAALEEYAEAAEPLLQLAHRTATRALVALFHARLDPAYVDGRREAQALAQIETAIADVENLSEDRLMRSFLELICAVVRTNYCQRDAGGAPKPYLSFKLDCASLSFLPLPRPALETFVYSPRVEGLHMRSAKVARGGLRWSDRTEDYRTELLGLLKAQRVKNAVIVPHGAKGAFVVKRPARGDGPGSSAAGGARLLCDLRARPASGSFLAIP